MIRHQVIPKTFGFDGINIFLESRLVSSPPLSIVVRVNHFVGTCDSDPAGAAFPESGSLRNYLDDVGIHDKHSKPLSSVRIVFDRTAFGYAVIFRRSSELRPEFSHSST